MKVQIKRIYEPPSKEDGFRLLVDRLWPRGVSKERAALNGWMKDISPSPELRKWFCHKEEHFKEFKTHYLAELRHNPAVQELQTILKEHKTVTLLYGARDPKINHAIVLLEFLHKSNR